MENSPNPTAAPPETCSTCIFHKSYRLLIAGASCLQSPLLLAVQLYWGWSFFQTGKGKLMHVDKVTDFFRSLHIPAPAANVYLASCTECLGGLLLLVGLGSRLVCLPLIFTLTIAYVTAESDSLKAIFSNPDKFTAATPFLFLVACLMVLAFGPGRFSIDWLLEKRFAKKNAASQT